jgi:hypothetical protein
MACRPAFDYSNHKGRNPKSLSVRANGSKKRECGISLLISPLERKMTIGGRQGPTGDRRRQLRRPGVKRGTWTGADAMRMPLEKQEVGGNCPFNWGVAIAIVWPQVGKLMTECRLMSAWPRSIWQGLPSR